MERRELYLHKGCGENPQCAQEAELQAMICIGVLKILADESEQSL